MKTEQILDYFKNNKSDIIAQVINLLPNALRGDRVNRTFFIKEEDGELVVDYFVYLGQVCKSDVDFFTITDLESIDVEDYDVEDFDDIDFYSLGYAELIETSLNNKIEILEINA